MYDVALSVAACARAGTRADVAWMILPAASKEAVMITPGGGHLGVLANGAFTGLLADAAARQLPTGRRVRHRVEEWEASTSGLPADSTVEFLVVPAAQFPEEVWPALMAREPVIIDSVLDGDDVTQIAVTTSASATGEEATALGAGGPSVEITDSLVRTVLVPGTTVVVAGGGPIADALIAQVSLLGWDVAVETRPDLVEGLTTRLSSADAVVVMGHDVETSSRCLQVALDSDAGYIGALGSRTMQQARADWLAYRDVTDLSRVHGPAGLDIGASTPAEIAVSIAAQIVSVTRHFVND